MSKLLIIDDEPNVLYSLEQTPEVRLSRGAQCRPRALQGIELVKQHDPDVVLLDVRLPDMSGLDAFEEIRKYDSRLPVIIITAHATTETAIEAMKRGAFEYLLKPLDLPELLRIVARAIQLSHLSRVPTLFGDEADSRRAGGLHRRTVGADAGGLQEDRPGGAAGRHRADSRRKRHGQGTGGPGDLLAQPAQRQALPGDQLRGHSGAAAGERVVRPRTRRLHRRRPPPHRQIRAGGHGTIFLDEIGDMTLATQAKMLRLLQDGRFERVGGNETIATDVRIIAATNQNLEQLVAEGRFREDLYYRLKVFAIQLPPLRRAHG